MIEKPQTDLELLLTLSLTMRTVLALVNVSIDNVIHDSVVNDNKWPMPLSSM